MIDRGDARRLEALRRTRLLDSDPEAAFDRLTRLATRLLGVPIAAVSLVDASRQFFKSAVGLQEPWASRRETPISHSFCAHACRMRSRLVVADAREHPVLHDNPAVTELGVVAYAGVPLIVSGEAIGAFCAIDEAPRAWSDSDIELLDDLAASVVSEIELRSAIRQGHEQRAMLDAVVESIGDAVLAVDTDRTFLVANGAARRFFAEGVVVGGTLPSDWSQVHQSIDEYGMPLAGESGALFRALRGFDTDDLTFTLTRPGASEAIWVEARGRTVRGPDGAVVAAVATYRDLTEKKRQADLYETVIRNIPRGAVSLFDRDMRCVAIDGSALRRSGGAPERYVGRTMREIARAVAGGSFDRVEALYQRVLSGETVTTDLEIGERSYEVHMAPVRDGLGGIRAGILLALDVTEERQTAAKLRQQEQIDRAILRNLPNGAVFMVDQSMRYVAADGPILPEVLRRANIEELVGVRVEDAVAAEGREGVLTMYREALAGISRHAEFRRGDLFFEVTTVPIIESDVVTHALIFVYDVTQSRREAETLRVTRDALAREQKLFQATIEHLAEGVALIDPERRVLLANPAYANMLGLKLEDVIGMGFDAFVAALRPMLADPRAFLEIVTTPPPTGAAEFVLDRPRRRVLRRVWTPVTVDDRACTLAMWQDVTAERDLLAERERQLLVDALTGIPNRRAAEATLKAEYDRAKRYGTRLSVALIDIDHFKRVNDGWGHAVGDAVLRAVAASLMGATRANDMVARWGGEEFIAVLPVALDGARTFAERVRRAIEAARCQPVGTVTVSVGVAELAEGEALDAVLARADERLYASKHDGRNRVSV